MKVPGTSPRLGRRKLLKSAGGVGLFVAALVSPVRLRGLFSDRAQGAEADVTNGFVIVPPDSAPPPTTRSRKRTPPLVSGPLVPPVDQRSFATAVQTALDAKVPLFTLPVAGPEFRDSGGIVVRNFKGEVFLASVGVERFVAARSAWVPWHTLTAEPGVPQPAPVWEGGSTHSGIRRFTPVDFLPRPGIAIQADDSCVAHWMDGEFRYTLDCQGVRSVDELRKIVEALEPA